MPRIAIAAASPLGVALSADNDRLALEGALDLRSLAEAAALFERWLDESTGQPERPHAHAHAHARARALDLRRLSALDTSGALLLCGLRERGVQFRGVRPEHQALFDLVGGLAHEPLPAPRPVARWRQLVLDLGRGADVAWHDARDVASFIGRSVRAIGQALRHPREWRGPSLSRHVAETGINALPIVALMAVMISVVIGYQGVAQLRPLGGEDFTINLVAVSVLREMGVLITAIMVAGRSGCAFTAEIGVMKARDEVDALQAMGLDAMQLLVVPRLLALVLTLPLLTFFADLMGLAGGGLIALVQLDVAPLQYLDRVRTAVDAGDLAAGLIKAPVFAFLIGVIGCMHGLRVHGSAESVGRETTRAVVKAIFVVIVLDALFSVLFEKAGL
ncbi:MAG: ABC transporter permease [Burkholderiales bacterium]|nr:ABC transporter permease [Burkholderiales bacterium]